MFPFVLPRLATDLAGRVFPGVWKPLFLKFPSWDGLPFPGRSSLPPSLSLLLSFIFFLHDFEDNDLLFCMPDVLCQHSEVVLWSLLSVEMFFWWICEGESGLPILFLCHLRTAPWTTFFFFCKSIMFSLFKNGVCVCICVYFFACVWVADYSIIVPNLWPSNSPLAVLWIFCPQPYGQW